MPSKTDPFTFNSMTPQYSSIICKINYSSLQMHLLHSQFSNNGYSNISALYIRIYFTYEVFSESFKLILFSYIQSPRDLRTEVLIPNIQKSVSCLYSSNKLSTFSTTPLNNTSLSYLAHASTGPLTFIHCYRH